MILTLLIPSCFPFTHGGFGRVLGQNVTSKGPWKNAFWGQWVPRPRFWIKPSPQFWFKTAVCNCILGFTIEKLQYCKALRNSPCKAILAEWTSLSERKIWHFVKNWKLLFSFLTKKVHYLITQRACVGPACIPPFFWPKISTFVEIFGHFVYFWIMEGDFSKFCDLQNLQFRNCEMQGVTSILRFWTVFGVVFWGHFLQSKLVWKTSLLWRNW